MAGLSCQQHLPHPLSAGSTSGIAASQPITRRQVEVYVDLGSFSHHIHRTVTTDGLRDSRARRLHPTTLWILASAQRGNRHCECEDSYYTGDYRSDRGPASQARHQA